MTGDQFIVYLQYPEKLDQSTLEPLREMIGCYPYFSLARMLYLRNLLNIKSYNFESELARQSIYISDRSLLYQFLYPRKSEKSRLELLPFDNDAFDRYFQVEKSKDKAPIGEEQKNLPATNDLIDRFISRNPSLGRLKDEEIIPDNEGSEGSDYLDDGLITETLADIYMKQGMYDEAIRSYKKLCLKFPEKNSYFAGQIEKIKKLKSKED